MCPDFNGMGPLKIKMKKLAVIGASYLQLPLIEKAREQGVETHCFAWEEGAVCKGVADYFYPISVLDKESIFEICKDKSIDGITTIATDMAVPSICFVAEKLGLISNSVHSAEVSTNKAAMRNAFKGKVNNPRFLALQNYSGFSGDFRYPVVVKPADRSGSRGVVKVMDEAAVEEAIRDAVGESFSGMAIVEEFIEGREVSVESISWKGRHYILAITDKVTTAAPHFVELAHHQPAILDDEIRKNLEKETIKALDALDIVYGAGHAEFKITDNGEIFVIEVGARMGGDFIGSHLVRLSTGYDFLKGVIDVALNRFTAPQFTTFAAAGVYFLCEDTKRLLPYFESETAFEVTKVLLDHNLKAATSSNDRSGFLVYQAPNRIELL